MQKSCLIPSLLGFTERKKASLVRAATLALWITQLHLPLGEHVCICFEEQGSIIFPVKTGRPILKEKGGIKVRKTSLANSRQNHFLLCYSILVKLINSTLQLLLSYFQLQWGILTFIHTLSNTIGKHGESLDISAFCFDV